MPKQSSSQPDAPHLPRSAPIDAYGNGGFAFAEMSHRGSLLCLPDAIWAWPVTKPAEIDEESLTRVFAAANVIDTLIVGTGTDVWVPPRGLREALRAVGVVMDADADWTGDPHLQHHDRRKAARRGGADRGAMSDAAAQQGGGRLLRRFGSLARFYPLCIDAVRAWPGAPRAAGAYMPSMSRYRVSTCKLASLCRAKCACNGGATCWPARAMAASRAIRSPPNYRWRSGPASLPVERLSRLIDEHQFDLYNDPMPTMAALEGYINDTSSALFSLAAAVLGHSSGEVEHLARHAGLAQGMAQVMASLPLDASRRQLFVPQQVLANHGCGIEEVFAGKETPNVRAALDQVLGEAREHLKTAFALLASVPPEARPAFLPLAQVRRDLRRMSRADNDPFVPRPAPRLRTLWTLWRASRARPFRP